MTSVAVVAPRSVPFVVGGAERHWDALVAALIDVGLDAALVALDTPESTIAEILASYRRFLELDVSDYDVVISGKYPSWMVRHPRHVRHLNHPLRGLYDLYPSHLDGPSDHQLATVACLIERGPQALLDWAEEQVPLAGEDPEWALPGPWAAAVVRALDADASRHLVAHAVVSEAVAGRSSYHALFPEGVPLAIVAPLTDLAPVPDVEPGAHFLAFGRLAKDKRFDLTIEAFGHSKLGNATPDPFELWIAGTGAEETHLGALAARTPGVHLLGHCSDEDLARFLASSVAVVATPRDEDYGLVAAEAHAAGRPVLTVSDSGGIAEQVRSAAPEGGRSQRLLITPPFARLLGRAMRELAHHPAEAERLGRAGRDQVAQRSWAPLVRLVRRAADGGQPRTKVLMLSTFVAEPVTGGGSRRLRAVANHLQRTFDVTVLALTNEVPDVRRRLLDDGVVQVAIGRSRHHLKADHEMQALVGVPVDDLAIGLLHPSTPAFATVLHAELERSTVVVLAQPFLATALPLGLSAPVVYDAYNVEVDLKQGMLEGRPGFDRLMDWCEQAEATALARASVVSAVSAADLARLCPAGCGHRNLVASNGVDDRLLSCEPGPGPERQAARARLLADLDLGPDHRPIILFVASAHAPNLAAGDLLATLARSNPDLLFVLAGSHSERPRSGPISLGRFPDRDLLRLLLAADVIVNPVSVGSGTNLKLVEALASGTPLVSTLVGARGIPDPESVLTLAEQSELLVGIRSVLAQPGSAGAKAVAGRTLAERHRWSVALAPLESAIADLAGVRLEP